MAGRLDDRVVLITGAASGIGRATVLRAIAEGARVAAIDERACDLHGSGVVVAEADVADVDALTAAIEQLAGEVGMFDGVFANAGILPPPRPTESIDLNEWHRVLAVNLTGAVMTLVASLPYAKDGSAMLLSGSSMAIRPREHRLAYVAAKAGVHAAGRALALELAPRRIRVNVIAPGLTDTPMVRTIPGHIEGGLPSVPLGDLVPPEEVAALAVHLLSDDASHITGSIVTIDGGRTAG